VRLCVSSWLSLSCELLSRSHTGKDRCNEDPKQNEWKENNDQISENGQQDQAARSVEHCNKLTCPATTPPMSTHPIRPPHRKFSQTGCDDPAFIYPYREETEDLPSRRIDRCRVKRTLPSVHAHSRPTGSPVACPATAPRIVHVLTIHGNLLAKGCEMILCSVL
jgi:hypothetical protein